MTISLIESMTTWLNAFPTTNGVTTTMSPAAIVLGKSLPDMGRKHISFGLYAMVHIGTNNSMKWMSVPAIARRAPNDNSGYYFMSVYSGREFYRNQWDELSIDDETIATVEVLAENEGQPLLPDKYPLFEWEPGDEIIDTNGGPDDADQNELFGEII